MKSTESTASEITSLMQAMKESSDKTIISGARIIAGKDLDGNRLSTKKSTCSSVSIHWRLIQKGVEVEKGLTYP
jgi:hypothetical protein